MILSKPNRHHYFLAGLFTASLLLSFWIYSPGLNSNFILDDKSNLQQLRLIQLKPDLNSALLFVFQGNSSVLGRPLSLLSFALQYNSWPADPYSFKYVNLMIHLLCACLLFILLTQITKLLKPKNEFYTYLPGIITLIWLIHPMQVSTVLYAIQRMAQLSALFTLLGLVLYLKGRSALADRKNIQAYSLAFVGIAVCGLLAILSKENGALLIVFILILEVTILNHIHRTRLWNIGLLISVVAPIILGLLYLLFNFEQLGSAGYQERPFSLSERLMTEARILIQYINNLIIIRPNAYGVYHDNITLSTSLLHPISTLFSILTIIALLFFAIKYRKRHALLSFSILWYFAAHSMESTVFPLELYFEHRNYIALIGPFLVLMLGLAFLYRCIKSFSLKPVFFIAIISWLGISIAMTSQEVKLWSQPTLQIKIWAREKPNSVRAQFSIAMTYLVQKEYRKARQTLKNIHIKFPEHTGILSSLIYFSCIDKSISPYSVNELLEKLKKAKRVSGFTQFTSRLTNEKLNGSCQNVSDDQYLKSIDILLANKSIKTKHAFLYLFKGQFNLSKQHYFSALSNFEKSLSLTAKVDTALLLSHTCELLKNRQCALAAIGEAYKISQYRLWDRLAYSKTIESIRTRIQQSK